MDFQFQLAYATFWSVTTPRFFKRPKIGKKKPKTSGSTFMSNLVHSAISILSTFAEGQPAE
jgi:hypothetical protein